MKYITIAAFAISVPLFVAAWLVPDLRLEDRNVRSALFEARKEDGGSDGHELQKREPESP